MLRRRRRRGLALQLEALEERIHRGRVDVELLEGLEPARGDPARDERAAPLREGEGDRERQQGDAHGVDPRGLRAVDGVPHDGVSDVGEVTADLVHAAGLGPRLHERHALAPGDDADAGESAHAVRIHGLPGEGALLLAEGRVGIVDAGEPRVDVELLPRRAPLDESEVALVDEVAAEGLREGLLAERGLGDDGEPGGHPIEAVHGPGAGEARLGDVEERRAGHAAAGDDRHPRGLQEDGVVRPLLDERCVRRCCLGCHAWVSSVS